MAEEGFDDGGVVKTALIPDGLAHGILEAAKALDKCQTNVCVLASNCDEPVDVKLAEALFAEHQISLIMVDDNKELGDRKASIKSVERGSHRKWLVVVV